MKFTEFLNEATTTTSKSNKFTNYKKGDLLKIELEDGTIVKAVVEGFNYIVQSKVQNKSNAQWDTYAEFLDDMDGSQMLKSAKPAELLKKGYELVDSGENKRGAFTFALIAYQEGKSSETHGYSRTISLSYKNSNLNLTPLTVLSATAGEYDVVKSIKKA